MAAWRDDAKWWVVCGESSAGKPDVSIRHLVIAPHLDFFFRFLFFLFFLF